LDFYLWGYVKSIVYRSPFTGIDDLKQIIRDVIMNIHTDCAHFSKGGPDCDPCGGPLKVIVQEEEKMDHPLR
jgi:hypothetical protein